VWIAEDVTILSNVSVGDGAILGAPFYHLFKYANIFMYTCARIIVLMHGIL